MGGIRYTLMVGCLWAAAAGCLVGTAEERAPGPSLARDLPLRIGSWQGRELEVSEQTYAILESRDVVVRRFETEGERPVFLTVAASSSSRKVAHPPEICYAGYGFEIVGREVRRLGHRSPRDVVLIDARRGARREVVAGWYQAGAKTTASFISQQLRLMAGQLLGGSQRAVMFRLATRAEGEPFEQAVGRLERFLDVAAGVLSPDHEGSRGSEDSTH